ncbi:hypothetical protein BDP27DRAFT_1429132 [Rhodocollybia butyracea]|uniref:F-box domain-containing protein n=1 Tax=Rhodocollybia butyracea TaxID=206335 RepID=A0A9P5TZ99_9AGAR|nr:hypothetical protein BDP27DRAFT_1429132 [Rhodocollybia butyracea]
MPDPIATCPQCGFHLYTASADTESAHTNHELLPASIEYFLRNNESPPESGDLLDIQTLLHQAENASADLESQISQMKESIRRLTFQRERITANIQAYRTVLHPIRRLPADIILEIFDWCVSVQSIEPDSVVLDNPELKLPGLRVVQSLHSVHPPWNLGQVSRNWRNIALSSPKLWSSVSIFLRTTHPSASIQRRVELSQVSLLSIYLTRSHDYPLSVYINSLHAEHPLLSMIYAQSHRWRNAVLYLPVETLRNLSFSIKGALPMLRTLLLSVTRDPGACNTAQENWENVITGDVVIDAFQYAPSLKCLAISQIPSFPTLFTMPWDQLLRFECNLKSQAHQLSENSMNLHILRSAHKLQMAMFRCCHKPILDFDNLQPIRHTHLHTLNLFSVMDSNPAIPHIGQLLDIVTLPTLCHLSIHTQRRELDACDTVLRFIERSDPKNLRVLLLNDMPMSVEATQNLLKIIPSVEHLGLSGVTDEVIRTMCWSGSNTTGVRDLTTSDTPASASDSGVILPKLRRLAFYGSESLSVNQRKLLGMIESRRSITAAVSGSLIVDMGQDGGGLQDSLTTPAMLERVEVSRKYNFSDSDTVLRLDRLVDEGLTLDQR